MAAASAGRGRQGVEATYRTGPNGSTLYITNYASASVSVINTATNTVTTTVPVGTQPFGIVVTPNGNTAYVTNSNDNTVSVINTATNSVTATVPVGNHPDGVAVTPDGAHVYLVSQNSNTATVIATATNTVTATIPVGAIPTGIAVSPDGSRTYVTNANDNTTSVINTATNTVTATIPVGAYPFAVAFAPVAAAADLAVSVTAQPHLGILVPYLTFTLTAHNTGPSAVSSATITASLPPGASATNLSAGCTTTSGTVTCTYGAIANGASTAKSFRIPLNLLSLGQVKVTAVRTASAPHDPNPANDTASATCTVVSVILATCP
ncbi:beta-propeller fold lactonase family protein [Streptomyces sp. NBC_00212]|uniref:YVTN family beta-propeller repeat protein n=1 Tax=Streptomyces sp. NBC_00212 TaxID=2975684 RepID=UPI003255A83E